MKIDTSANALLYTYTSLNATAASDPFALTDSSGAAAAGATASVTGATGASQISSLASPQSLGLQAALNAQLATLSNGPPTSTDADASSGNVHSMTNAQLEAYAKANNLGDVAGSFQVDYASMDRSASGEAAAYQSLMSDPTQHDFVQQFGEAAQWQLQNGSTSGYDHFETMANELTDTASGKTASA